MILERLKQAAFDNAECIAYKSGGETLTYRELWARAARSAELLLRQGTSPVLLCADKQADMPVSMLACLMAGRAYVPVSGSIPTERLQNIAKQTGAELCLTVPELKEKACKCCENAEVNTFSEWNAQAAELGGCDGREACDRRESSDGRETCDGRETDRTEACDNIAYIIFTSGSTGEPKGVPISKANLDNFAEWIGNLAPLSEYRHCAVLNQASFSFDLSVADLYYALCNGHTLVAGQTDVRSDYTQIFTQLSQEHIRVAVMTPTCMNLCLTEPTFTAENYPDLRCVYFCGERLEKRTAATLLRRFPGIAILNAYGPTEATSAVSAIRITESMTESDDMLPVGEIGTAATDISVENGELVLRGKSVFGGYMGGQTGGWFSENGQNGYRTGDLGEIRNGLIYCLGRKDSQIKWKGYRIEPGEIEAGIAAIPGVLGCAVIPTETPGGAVRNLKAYVLGTIDAEYIRETLRKRLPDYMIPAHITIVEQLPVTVNGKLDRRGLKNMQKEENYAGCQTTGL